MEMKKDNGPIFFYPRVKPAAQMASRIETFLILLIGSLYGVVLAGPDAGLGIAATDKVLALSILAATASGRIFWLLFAMGASLSGIAWAHRVIDLGFGHMQLTEYMVLGMGINLILRSFTYPVYMPRQMKRLILFAFLPALAFALAASIGGWINGNPEYTRPLRACLVVVGLLYAFLNIKNSDQAQRVFFGVVYLALMTSLIRFFLPFFDITPKGLGPFLLAAPVISLLLSKTTLIARLGMIIAVLLFTLTSFTLTIFLSVALTIALYFSYRARAKIIRQLMLFFLAVSTLAMILVIGSVLRDELVLGLGTTVASVNPSVYKGSFFAHPLDRIRFKVYDRLVLWIPAISEIANSPFQLNAGGRTFIVPKIFGSGKKDWSINVHNVFIEVMRQFSLPGSIFFNVVILVALITLWQGLKQNKQGGYYVLAWSLFGLSFLPGFILGFYPVSGEIGVYFWLACGVSYKLRLLATLDKSYAN